MTRDAAGGGGSGVALPSYDPWPGDPSVWDGVAARLADRETQSNQVRSGIIGMISDPSLATWLGQSATAFKDTLEPVPSLLGAMVYAYGTAAQAVRTYAQQVRNGQADFTKAQAGIQAHADAHPDGVDGWGGDKWLLGQVADSASSDHEKAMKACAAVVAEAAQDLRRVQAALSDARYADFNATFTGLGGQLSDLGGLEYMGNDVLPSTVDPAKILDTIDFLRQHLGDGAGGMMPFLGAWEAYQRISGMTPAEVDALLAMMTPADRQALNAAIGAGSNDQRVAWSNLLLTDVDASTLGLVQKDLGNVQPDWHTQYTKDLHWAAADGPLFGPDGVNIEKDLHQGQDGDCWFLSSAAAISERNPDFVPARMHANANGTYTVTFYKDGQPVQITVDNQLPVDGNGNFAYAQPGSDSKWVAVYEKAYAQYRGGYGHIDGGGGGEGLHDLTGQHTDSPDPGDHSLKDVAQWIHDGRAVTTGSHKEKGFLWWDGDGEYVDGGKIVTAHEYSVESVDLNAHPPTITLLNPWGVDAQNAGQSIGKITLTESEWHKYFDEMGVTKVRP